MTASLLQLLNHWLVLCLAIILLTLADGACGILFLKQPCQKISWPYSRTTMQSFIWPKMWEVSFSHMNWPPVDLNPLESFEREKKRLQFYSSQNWRVLVFLVLEFLVRWSGNNGSKQLLGAVCMMHRKCYFFPEVSGICTFFVSALYQARL